MNIGIYWRSLRDPAQPEVRNRNYTTVVFLVVVGFELFASVVLLLLNVSCWCSLVHSVFVVVESANGVLLLVIRDSGMLSVYFITLLWVLASSSYGCRDHYHSTGQALLICWWLQRDKHTHTQAHRQTNSQECLSLTNVSTISVFISLHYAT